ncbi:Transcription factor bHLH25 [Striga hermonthica]|uniref:Transcription factor bHLH25 n=1 Tax=Striga hermonthica TaxID=68872 RepID=A0A9N7NUU8_STRHE|nr:Transcription factor bHLH25 [Striga hermonthica]
MDCPEISWLSEMGLENSLLSEQCDFMLDNTITLDEEIAAVLGHDLDMMSSSSSTLINTLPSSNSISSLYTDNFQYSPPPPPPPPPLPNNNNNNMGEQQRPAKLRKGNKLSSIDRGAAPPIILNFDKNSSPTKNQKTQACEEEEEATVVKRKKIGGRVRPPSQTYDHIIAERKRREQLSQRFVALSTIVPGLKKMDKTSVLGDAINYLKHLQERVKTLEEQASRQTMESVVLVRKSQIAEEGSSDDTSAELPLPEIEARASNNHLLLRVHCQKHKGVLVNLLTNIEMLNMAVINTNVTPFGNFALHITIVAEMEKEFNLSMKQVVKRLRAALKLAA